MPFTFRRQPFSTLYMLCGVVFILVSMPVWIVSEALPSWRPRPSWTLKRALLTRTIRVFIRIVFQTSLPAPPSINKCEQNAHSLGFVWIDATPDLIVGDVKEIAEKNGVKAERTAGFWYGPRGPDGQAGQRASPGERVVFHVHGGGHIFGTAHPDFQSGVVPVCNGYLEHFGSNLRIFALEYRLSSAKPFKQANPFPASLIDAVAGYRYLVHDLGFDPRHIILSGDSAGGGIVFNLARYIATANLAELPRPGGLILLSPSMDWGMTDMTPESSTKRNARSDVVNAILESGYTRRALLGNMPEEVAAKNAWISPGSLQADWTPGMYTGFPRTVVLAGGAEYTLSSMHVARDRLVKDIGEKEVTFIEYPDALHDFLMVDWHEPERSEGFRELGEWVNTLEGVPEA